MKSIRFLKTVSLAAALVFSVTGLSPVPAHALAVPAASAPETLPALPTNLKDASIPAEFGRTEAFYQGTGGRTVILIQDAHAIPEAQRNIRNLLEYLGRTYGVDRVALEGAASGIDLETLRSFPRKDALEKVFGEYLEKGELTGGIMAAALSPLAASYSGIEDWALYEKGYGYFMRAAGAAAEIEEWLAARTRKLTERKQKTYSPALLEADRALDAFREGRTNVLETLAALAKFKTPPAGSEIALMLEESSKSSRANESSDTEIREAAAEIRNFFDRAEGRAFEREKRSFNEKRQAFNTGRTSSGEFALCLAETAAQFGLPVRFSSAMLDTAGRQKKIRDIQGTRFFDAFEAYARDVKESLYRTAEERALDREGALLELLGTLARLELTRRQWNELATLTSPGADAKPVFSEKGFAALVPDAKIRGALEAHIAFYKNSEDRDAVFIRRLRDMLADNAGKQKAAVFIAGGFHTEGLSERLRQENISYLLVAPKILRLPGEIHYRDQMKGLVSWRDYFRVENGRVNIYKAFVRATRDRLLRASAEDTGPLLKEWRDNILRDLSDAERIADAGKYTRFLDEAGPRVPADDTVRRLRAKSDAFVEKLGDLEKSGGLTDQNIHRLLEASRFLPAAVVPGTDGIHGEYLGLGAPAVLSEQTARSEIRGLLPNRGELIENYFTKPLMESRKGLIRGGRLLDLENELYFDLSVKPVPGENEVEIVAVPIEPNRSLDQVSQSELWNGIEIKGADGKTILETVHIDWTRVPGAEPVTMRFRLINERGGIELPLTAKTIADHALIRQDEDAPTTTLMAIPQGPLPAVLATLAEGMPDANAVLTTRIEDAATLANFVGTLTAYGAILPDDLMKRVHGFDGLSDEELNKPKNIKAMKETLFDAFNESKHIPHEFELFPPSTAEATAEGQIHFFFGTSHYIEPTKKRGTDKIEILMSTVRHEHSLQQTGQIIHDFLNALGPYHNSMRVLRAVFKGKLPPGFGKTIDVAKLRDETMPALMRRGDVAGAVRLLRNIYEMTSESALKEQRSRLPKTIDKASREAIESSYFAAADEINLFAALFLSGETEEPSMVRLNNAIRIRYKDNPKIKAFLAAEDLGDTAKVRIVTLRIALSRILDNLIKNAYESITETVEKTRRKGHLVIRTLEGERGKGLGKWEKTDNTDYVFIQIRNEGATGFTPADVERVNRGEGKPTTKGLKGNGLGLVNVYELIRKQLGGDIDLRSAIDEVNPGKTFAEFTIRLPLALPDASRSELRGAAHDVLAFFGGGRPEGFGRIPEVLRLSVNRQGLEAVRNAFALEAAMLARSRSSGRGQGKPADGERLAALEQLLVRYERRMAERLAAYLKQNPVDQVEAGLILPKQFSQEQETARGLTDLGVTDLAVASDGRFDARPFQPFRLRPLKISDLRKPLPGTKKGFTFSVLDLAAEPRGLGLSRDYYSLTASLDAEVTNADERALVEKHMRRILSIANIWSNLVPGLNPSEWRAELLGHLGLELNSGLIRTDGNNIHFQIASLLQLQNAVTHALESSA